MCLVKGTGVNMSLHKLLRFKDVHLRVLESRQQLLVVPIIDGDQSVMTLVMREGV